MRINGSGGYIAAFCQSLARKFLRVSLCSKCHGVSHIDARHLAGLAKCDIPSIATGDVSSHYRPLCPKAQPAEAADPLYESIVLILPEARRKTLIRINDAVRLSKPDESWA